MTEPPLATWSATVRPPAGGVHVWRIDLDAVRATGHGALAPAELARAERILDPGHRRRFLALRHAARRILADYVEVAPEALVLGAGPRGKPHIAWPPSRWAFNQTDSRMLALLSVCDAGSVGIDLEAVRPMPRWREISRRMFPAAAHAELATAAPAARDRLFFAHWTALEARQKATGEGLFGVRAAEVEWEVRHFAPLPGWIAALALPAGCDAPVGFYVFDPLRPGP